MSLRQPRGPARHPGREASLRQGMRRGVRRGFTLIELVAALAVFALVSVMALQAMTGALRGSAALEGADAEAAALARSLTLLRRDLDALVPMPFLPPGAARAEPALHAPEGAGVVALSLGGQPRAAAGPGAAPDLPVRAVWRHDRASGRLTRQLWPGLAPSGSGAGAAAAEVTMLEGVTALRLRVLDNRGTARPPAPPGSEDEAGPEAIVGRPAPLPPGVVVELETTRFGALRLVVVP